MGRWSVEPGQLVAHSRFEGHDNFVPRSGTWVLNMPVPDATSLPPVFTVDAPDEVIAAVRRGEAVLPYLRPHNVVAPVQVDWPDVLAARLRQGPVAIAAWAREVGLAPSTVSRGFYAAFGVTPARYRLENQALQAMRSIAATAEPLAGIAASCGFGDQAHMTRAVKAVSGRTPGRWRVKSVQ